MNMIGQDSLINKINNLTLDSFPRSIILVGEKGSGKHLICSYISQKFELDVIDISMSLDLDTINQINQRVKPYLYIIDIESLVAKSTFIKCQNTILKFLEEPLNNAYIVILCPNLNLLLPTIQNRCQVWLLNPYSPEILNQFLDSSTDNTNILKLARTPGELKSLSEISLPELFNFANKIIDKISCANYANVFKLSTHIEFSDSIDKNLTSPDLIKYQPKLLIRTLLTILRERIIECSDYHLLEAYKLTDKVYNDMNSVSSNARCKIENYFSRLWRIMRG